MEQLQTFQDLVNHFEIYGGKIASYAKRPDDTYREVSFGDLVQSAKNFASYLDSVKHLKKGGMVALCADNCPDWFMAYYGIVYNGIWAVPFDAKLSDREIKNLILDCGAKIFVVSRAIFETVQSEPEVMNRVQEFIVIDPDEKTLKNKKVVAFADVLEEGSLHPLKTRKVDPGDIASLIYTSGTTGNPKGVLLSHANLIFQIHGMHKIMPFSIADTQLSVLPLHHTFEFSVENTLMYCGAAVTYAESFKPNKLFANITETHVTIMVAVPMLYEKIFDGIMRNIRSMGFPVKQILMGLFRWTSWRNKKRGDIKSGVKVFGFLRKKAHLDTIRFMVSGAAPFNFKVSRGLEALGLQLLNGYGLTEASPVLAVNRLGTKIINESVGIPLDGVELKIVNPDRDGNGEIYAKGPGVMQGYYNNKKATAETISKDSWLHTGDIGRVETHYGSDYLYITGRSKNIIVTAGGKNVFPEEIEELINDNKLVLESLAIGVPVADHSKGENIYAMIVPDYEYIDSMESIQGFKNTEEHIRELIDKHIKEVNKKLRDYQKIRGFRIRTEEFPKTSTRKIKRFLFSGKDFLDM